MSITWWHNITHTLWLKEYSKSKKIYNMLPLETILYARRPYTMIRELSMNQSLLMCISPCREVHRDLDHNRHRKHHIPSHVWEGRGGNHTPPEIRRPHHLLSCYSQRDEGAKSKHILLRGIIIHSRSASFIVGSRNTSRNLPNWTHMTAREIQVSISSM